jgi:hypothetical protein
LVALSSIAQIARISDADKAKWRLRKMLNATGALITLPENCNLPALPLVKNE